MALTVKLVNPERALSQTSPAWYADGSDECAFVGEVALGDRRLLIYVDGSLRGHGPNGPIRSGDALREVCTCDADMQISGETEEISIKETPFFVLEGEPLSDDEAENLWQEVWHDLVPDGEVGWRMDAYFDSLEEAVRGAVAYLKTGNPEGAGEYLLVEGLLASALKFEPAPEPAPEQAVVWEPASVAETHVVVRYTAEDPPTESELMSNNPTEVAEFMASALRNWCVDDEIEIIINGKSH